MCNPICWRNFISNLSNQRTKRQHSLANVRLVKRTKGSGWGEELEKRHDVISGGCQHYASSALNCCTDKRQQMNTLTWPKEIARNSIDIAHSSNIGTQVDVKLYTSHYKQPNIASMKWEPEASTDKLMHQNKPSSNLHTHPHCSFKRILICCN